MLFIQRGGEGLVSKFSSALTKTGFLSEKFILTIAECNVDSIVLGQAAGVEHVSFYSRTELLTFLYNEP